MAKHETWEQMKRANSHLIKLLDVKREQELAKYENIDAFAKSDLINLLDLKGQEIFWTQSWRSIKHGKRIVLISLLERFWRLRKVGGHLMNLLSACLALSKI
jgi:hypothetical protein